MAERVASLKDLVEALDPKRHDPPLEYEFSDGKRFYGDQNRGAYKYTVVDGEIVE
jgi:hypothetical protein